MGCSRSTHYILLLREIKSKWKSVQVSRKPKSAVSPAALPASQLVPQTNIFFKINNVLILHSSPSAAPYSWGNLLSLASLSRCLSHPLFSFHSRCLTFFFFNINLTYWNCPVIFSLASCLFPSTLICVLLPY